MSKNIFAYCANKYCDRYPSPVQVEVDKLPDSFTKARCRCGAHLRLTEDDRRRFPEVAALEIIDAVEEDETFSVIDKDNIVKPALVPKGLAPNFRKAIATCMEKGENGIPEAECLRMVEEYEVAKILKASEIKKAE